MRSGIGAQRGRGAADVAAAARVRASTSGHAANRVSSSALLPLFSALKRPVIAAAAAGAGSAAVDLRA